MHPAEQLFWSALAARLQPFTQPFDALGQALSVDAPLSIVVVLTSIAGLALVTGKERLTHS